MSTSEQENVLARVAALERQNRLLRWITLGLGLLVIAGVCLSFLNLGAQANAPAPKAKSEELVLHDEAGKERIVLKAEKDNPRIQILNSAGKPVVQMGGSYIHFYDSKGIPRLVLASGNKGAKLLFLDENSLSRTEISAGDNPLFLLRDEKGHQILEVLKEGPKLTFFDKEGKPLFTKP